MGGTFVISASQMLFATFCLSTALVPPLPLQPARVAGLNGGGISMQLWKTLFDGKDPRSSPEQKLARGQQKLVKDSYGSFVNPRAIGYQNSGKKNLKAVPATYAPGRSLAARRTVDQLKKAKPNSVSANYPTNKGKNIQIQSNGFGTFINPFQLAKGKSKYGMPTFLPNGNVNPAFLAAERKAMLAQKRTDVKVEAAKVKKLQAKKMYLLEDFIKYDIGAVDKKTPREKGI